MPHPIIDALSIPTTRLRGRHIAAVWFLAAITAVLADNGPTGTAGTLIHFLIVLPSAIAVAVLVLWTYARWTARRRR